MDEGLRALPDVIADAVERGMVAKMPPTMTPSAQRLFASLKLPVLFVEDADMPDLANVAVRHQESVSRLEALKVASDPHFPLRRRVLALMITEPLWRHEDILAVVGGSPWSLYGILQALTGEGLIERVSRGLYRLPSTLG